MTRSRDADPAETIESVVAATRKVIEDHGADGVSFRRVAKQAELSLGTVTYYFPSREALLESALDGHHAWLVVERERRLAQLVGGEPLRDVAADAIRSVFREMCRQREALRLRRLVTLQRGELAKGRREESLNPALEAFAVAWSARGNISPGKARLVAQSLMFAVGRYALLSDQERMEVTGTAEPAAALTAIETHLVELFLASWEQAEPQQLG